MSELKRKDLLTIWSILDSLRNAKLPVRPGFIIAKNRNSIQPEINCINESLFLNDHLKEYESKRLELCYKYCSKDSLNKPIIDSGNFMFTDENKVLFDEEFEKLKNEMPDAHSEMINQEEAMKQLLDEDISIELYPIDLSAVPDNLLTVHQLEILYKYGLISE